LELEQDREVSSLVTILAMTSVSVEFDGLIRRRINGTVLYDVVVDSPAVPCVSWCSCRRPMMSLHRSPQRQ